jgi:hypothetical protein
MALARLWPELESVLAERPGPMDSQPSVHELGRREVRQSQGLHRSRAEQITSRCAKV